MGAQTDEMLVSVVTPVFNGADYLEECVESVLAQTHRNWEYVIVDNASTDGTLEIARRYERRDARIRVVAEGPFVGQIENANRAIRRISPESAYCKVVHADDWLFPECLERMVDLAVRHPSVGIVSAYRLEETRVTLDGLSSSVAVLPGREVARSTLLGGPYPFLFGSPSSILIRSDLIRKRQPFYNEDNPWDEDTEVCLDMLQESDFGFVHQVLTFTRRAEGSPFSSYLRLNAQIPGHLKHLLRYGPVYLPRSDYQRHLAGLVARYGLMLVSNPAKLADGTFRAHHRAEIRHLACLVRPGDVLAGTWLQVRRMRETKRLRPGFG